MGPEGALFDRVTVVDWSAAGAPTPARPSRDSIWIATAGPGPQDEAVSTHRTRRAAEAHLAALVGAGGRHLIGFDFPMGYPAGLAARLTGRASARAVHAWLARHLTDGPDNRNDRFALAAAINRELGGPGPFWGRPAALDLPDLPARRLVDYPALGLAERRAVERAVPRAQPVWKLYTTGSVGSQALTGLPVIHRLAEQGARVWPFEPLAAAGVVLAEVYPSLLAAEVAAHMAQSGEAVKDRAQVRLLARALLRLDQDGGLAPLLAPPPDAAAAEEGWILGAGHVAALRAALGGAACG
jgi:molybdopterin-guanine dinucleotide biosynthesis protein B